MTKKNVKKVEPAGTSGYAQTVGDGPVYPTTTTWVTPTENRADISRVSHVRRAIFQTIEYFKDLVEDDEFDAALTELDNLDSLLNSIRVLHKTDDGDYDD